MRCVTFHSLVSLAVFVTGCEGAFGPAAKPYREVGLEAPIDCATADTVIPPQPIRRLTNTEYTRTLRDLFPMVTVTLPALPAQSTPNDFDNIAETLGADDLLVQRWEQGAYLYADAITRSPTTLNAFLPCAASATNLVEQQTCGRVLIADFGKRALRRPLEATEAQTYAAFFDARLADIDFAGAVELTVMAMLQSPAFLYRIELDPDGFVPGGLQPLNDYELASRVSYLVTGSTPDAALLAAADAHALATREAIEAHVRRLLETPAARSAVVDFHRQWLDFDRINQGEHGERAPRYTQWNEALRAAIREEQDRFVASTLFDGEGTVSALLTSNKTYVNATLSKLYGVPGPADDATWIEATLPENERAGILTRAGFLASHSHSEEGSPPLRGIFVMTRLFCEPTPAPPPGVNVTAPTAEPGSAPATNRERYEARTSPQTCQGCHARMNGFGYGFEKYDAIGAFRTEDAGIPVDASGDILGTDVNRGYDGAVELSRALAESERVRDCVATKWLRYAQGRAPSKAEQCTGERIAQRFAESGGNIKELIVAIATSDEFRHRPTIAGGLE